MENLHNFIDEFLIYEFNQIAKLKMFEIEVTDTRTKETEYITFDISIDNNYLIAQHIGLTYEEEQSNKISFVSVELEDAYTLDEHINGLYEECINKINTSDHYVLNA